MLQIKNCVEFFGVLARLLSKKQSAIPDVSEFIRNAAVTPKLITLRTTLNGRKLPKRFLFVKLKKYVRNFWENNAFEPRLIGISGLRGVGKTSLL